MGNNNDALNSTEFDLQALSGINCLICNHPVRFSGECSNPDCIINKKWKKGDVMELTYDYEGTVQRGVRSEEDTKKIEECLETITAEYGPWNNEMQKQWLEAYMYIRQRLDLPVRWTKKGGKE